MPDIASIQAYPDLSTLLGRQQVESILCTLEMDEVGPLAAPAIEQALDRVMTSVDRISSWPQATWTAKDQQLQWLQTQLQYTARISGDFRLDAGLAARHAASKLQQMMSAVSTASRVRFVALILDLQFSGMDLPAIGPYLATFVRWSGPDLADAEWRVARRYEDRYFVNWLVSQYETREFRIKVPAGVKEVALVTTSGVVLKDRGLRLRVDVNTKVNIADGMGAIEIIERDVERLRDLAVDAVAVAKRALRGES